MTTNWLIHIDLSMCFFFGGRREGSLEKLCKFWNFGIKKMQQTKTLAIFNLSGLVFTTLIDL